MSRRRRKTQSTPSQRATATERKGIPTWLTVAGTVSVTIGAAFGALLINGPVMVENAEKFVSWYYADKEWQGAWSTSFEGNVDHADMALSEDTDLRISLDVDKGKLSGIIGTNNLCSVMPYKYTLLEGDIGITRSTASVNAYEIVGGKKTFFARLKLERVGGGVLTVVRIEDPYKLFPELVRLGLHPIKTEQEEDELFPVSCRDLKASSSNDKQRKPVAELKSSWLKSLEENKQKN